MGTVEAEQAVVLAHLHLGVRRPGLVDRLVPRGEEPAAQLEAVFARGDALVRARPARCRSTGLRGSASEPKGRLAQPRRRRQERRGRRPGPAGSCSYPTIARAFPQAGRGHGRHLERSRLAATCAQSIPPIGAEGPPGSLAKDGSPSGHSRLLIEAADRNSPFQPGLGARRLAAYGHDVSVLSQSWNQLLAEFRAIFRQFAVRPRKREGVWRPNPV